MADERRSESRYAVRRPMLARLPKGDVDGVCTSISMSGGFFACDAQPALGETVRVSIQPRRASRADIDLHGTVAYVVKGGTLQPRGFALQWLPPPDPEPLERLVRWAEAMDRQGLSDTPSARRDTLVEAPVPENLDAAPDSGNGGPVEA